MEGPFEARHYTARDGGAVQCVLCPHDCAIKPDRTGICGVRRNTGGRLFTEIYGRLTSLAMDPIEKKPLYHFYPGSSILSIGTKGCNLKCPYCQNWHISQDLEVPTTFRRPAEIITAAVKNGSVGIAYTYSEPIIWFEYVMDTAALAKREGLVNVMVTNGFINRGPLEELFTVIDAMNIDLKAFREETYRKVQKGKLEDVKNSIIACRETGCHLEVTTLLVTGLNDSMDELKGIIEFLASVDRAIPWHISRYYPNYHYSSPPTDVEFMMRVYGEAVKRLDYVYCGNISSDFGGSDTVCPSCKTVVIQRHGYSTQLLNYAGGSCAKCGADLGIRS